MTEIKIIDTNIDNIQDYGFCSYKSVKTSGYPEKLSWLRERYKEGLRIKILYSERDGPQGMIEYIPGEYCWRPVDSVGYMFIHCVFVGYKKTYKGKGYGSLLIDECIKDAKKAKMFGVAVVTRKGSFMVGKHVFLKKGFGLADQADPDFELLALKFEDNIKPPKFKPGLENRVSKYKKELTIIRADQCPYTVKNVNEIMTTSENEFKIKAQVINLKSHKEARNSPCPFGSFCIIYKGKIVAHHPISKTRFKNIMNKEII